MDIIAAYQQVGTYRGAAEICGTTHKTVRRVIERAEAGETGRVPVARARNYDAGDRGGREAGEGIGRSDLGEAAVAGRQGGGVSGITEELPPPGR